MVRAWGVGLQGQGLGFRAVAFGPCFVFHYYFEVFIILSNRNNTYFRNLNFSGFGVQGSA